ncbi:MAG: nickel pincer cofactor biosynthesis protein LarC [Deltaproteobacteria bacterium]|nr:nickel pincer cofactor biosynthesis protein LarC [Deltaproteobacteria bacterium]
MVQRALHFEPFGGASGDMILAALVDLGVPIDAVDSALAAVGLGDLRLAVEPTRRAGIAALHARFVDAHGEPVDPLERGGAHAGHGDGHDHTPWPQLRRQIQQSSLASEVRNRALRIFERLAAAEAQVHGVEIERVELHEVGGVDSIADVVGIAAAVEHLGVQRITCDPIPLGGLAIDVAHGCLPAPAPAAVQICLGVPVRGIEVDYECTTPTGAAALTALATGFGPLPSGTLRGVGIGAGRRDPAARANVLRALVLDADRLDDTAARGDLVEISVNLDDESGEVCGETLARLLAAGALDAWAVPATMKKGRPAVVVNALASADRGGDLCELLLRETSTFGVRWHAVARRELDRRSIEVETAWGRVAVKLALLGERPIKSKPEFEDCRRLSDARGVPLRDVIAAAERAAAELKR